MRLDAATSFLLTAAWACLTLGIAQENWPLTWAATPSLLLATAAHALASRERTRQARRTVEAARGADG